MPWTPPDLTAGSRLTAEKLTEVTDQIAYLTNPPFSRVTAAQSRTSSTTMIDVTQLVAAAEANKVYRVELVLNVDGATAGDIRYEVDIPAGASLLSWRSYSLDAADTVANGSVYRAVAGFPAIHGTLGAGTPSLIVAGGTLVMAGTAGNVQVQFAQGTSSATATRILAGSTLELLERA